MLTGQKSMDAVKAEDKAVQCPECKSNEIVNLDGEIYCKTCGLVLE